MIKLNLVANCVEHDALKEYLEENASVTLAEKINNGVLLDPNALRSVAYFLCGLTAAFCDLLLKPAHTRLTSVSVDNIVKSIIVDLERASIQSVTLRLL